MDAQRGGVASYGLLETMIVMREVRGVRFCEKFVGRLRTRAGPEFASNVTQLSPQGSERAAWAKCLADHCRQCGLCDVAKR